MTRAGVPDSWMVELEEAMRLSDDVSGRISECNALMTSKADPSRVVSVARRKIAMLSTKLDRLESLLQNSSAKSQSEKEMYRRQDMVLGLRSRLKQMSSSLSNSQNSQRGSLLSQNEKGPPVETDRTAGVDNRGLIGVQRQIMREQDQDLVGLETTVKSTKHIALAVNEELDLHTQLLDDMDQHADETNSRLKTAQRKLALFNKRLGGGHSLLCICITLVTVVILVLIILRLVNVW